MRIFIFFLISLILFFCSPNYQTNNCSSFRVGKFKYNSKTDGSIILINRTDSTQTELNQTTGLIDTMKIVWTDSCTYSLMDFSLSNKYLHVPDSILKIPLQTKILKSTNEYYVFEANKEGVPLIYRDTIWRVK